IAPVLSLAPAPAILGRWRHTRSPLCDSRPARCSSLRSPFRLPSLPWRLEALRAPSQRLPISRCLTRSPSVPPSSALTWTNVATVALVFAVSVLAGVFGDCAFIANVGGPPVLLGLIVSVSLGVGAPSLRRRVRGLLERAFLHHARPAGTETLRS